ncbi:phosphoadenosine phosphosulfate reductase family protein [Chitinophaga sp. 212800010-3]|uniref:phosphoadenosine phosphosulfate reductase domain-containing protein n=1 Tax=unclassified Chitinophaga TaxID=2619133 RepID=UPI002DE5972C|nr:3'-phosphoadenosine 5'-phosphosulfate sulfotransferase (PAPS reductase)/FAD synthetase [Chitinophaga sp. 212800010-3]
MKKKMLISFSGGRTSAFMTRWLLTNKQDEYDMIVVFANTGKEREETLSFIQECDSRFQFHLVWIESQPIYERGKGVSARIVDFATASRNGEPFEAFIKKHGIPNMGAPKCSRELKAYAIRAYARSIGWKKYTTAIGIRTDERRRINWKEAERQRIVYPLVNMIPTTSQDINIFWSKQEFDLRLSSYEGNCDLCWKKSKRKLLTILQENPQLASWWVDMEKKYENFVPQGSRCNLRIKPPLRFYRDHLSIHQLIEQSQQPFRRAADESREGISCSQMQLFQNELDKEDAGCANSCEGWS